MTARAVINANAEGKAIAKALRSLVTKARAAGCKNPRLFFEAESMAVFVLDGGHEHYIDAEASPGERQEAIVARAYIPEPFDTGAW